MGAFDGLHPHGSDDGHNVVFDAGPVALEGQGFHLVLTEGGSHSSIHAPTVILLGV